MFSGEFFHWNVVFEGIVGIPVFDRCHRIFLQEFLWDRNSLFTLIPMDSSGFLQIPVSTQCCLA